MSAKTVYMVYGGATSDEYEDEVAAWYKTHLIEMCTLPGLISAQLFKPAIAQMPRLTVKLPKTMALYEFETDDLAGNFRTLWAASLAKRIPPPRPEAFELHPTFQSCVYELDCEFPENHGNEPLGEGLPPLPPARKHIMMVFGSPTSEEAKPVVDAWWPPHVEEMTTSPGLIACSFYRPSKVQLPRLMGDLPQNMAICEFDSDDIKRDIAKLVRIGMEGHRTGKFVPGESIASPPVGSFLLDPVYQTGVFELVAQWPNPA
ncbi:hypothetical protein [Novosphingobium sp. PP1Y]|uniref:hypothetical protein n=1 Tax=Novosphingobium sp. PP1Y TaxID=702113 RepID=UPI00020EF36C|nr:hypothetical protein [Novosphingobium sp. PP1Y]CCA94015.1 hypothetical protein PP1Y_AT32800 [Novosphingobium sp. PP1Y]